MSGHAMALSAENAWRQINGEITGEPLAGTLAHAIWELQERSHKLERTLLVVLEITAEVISRASK